MECLQPLKGGWIEKLGEHQVEKVNVPREHQVEKVNVARGTPITIFHDSDFFVDVDVDSTDEVHKTQNKGNEKEKR